MVVAMTPLIMDQRDPVYQSGPFWWFWNEHWTLSHGPFESEEGARLAAIAYAESL